MTFAVRQQLPVLWTPMVLTNQKGGYIADDPRNTILFNQLDTIYEVTGSGLNAVTDTARPINRANLINTLNGRPVWTADASNPTAQGCFSISSSLIGSSAPGITLYSVHRYNVTPAITDHVIAYVSTATNGTASAATIQRSYVTANDTIVGGRRLDADPFAQITDATNRGTNWIVAGGVFDYANALLTMSLNGTTTGPSAFQTAGTLPAQNPYQVSIGHYYGGSGNTSADYAEVWFIVGALSTADRQRMDGYLSWSWGQQANLAAGHPYLLSPPYQ
jgi:hypothetical protein